jgi:hypothetical protein
MRSTQRGHVGGHGHAEVSNAVDARVERLVVTEKREKEVAEENRPWGQNCGISPFELEMRVDAVVVLLELRIGLFALVQDGRGKIEEIADEEVKEDTQTLLKWSNRLIDTKSE